MNISNLNLTELTKQEMVEINGGESGWYWTMYGLRVLADKFLAPIYTDTPAVG